MANRSIDISLDGVGENKRPTRRNIDIPLDGGRGADGINDKEYEFVNRHHEEYKEMRRRAREQGGF
ncbi:hypothetical protein H6B10_05065 [Gemmiger formicilis]|uniref:hypothetical protein n=1 Tax=Gemmiger formicilis TaxID=745368 RepID=UPI0019574359|nr:hypothetical protein [Gemmiger formicilis]MBM6899077.1 hypothetical protein [Gemmiger formicilis]